MKKHIAYSITHVLVELIREMKGAPDYMIPNYFEVLLSEIDRHDSTLEEVLAHGVFSVAGVRPKHPPAWVYSAPKHVDVKSDDWRAHVEELLDNWGDKLSWPETAQLRLFLKKEQLTVHELCALQLMVRTTYGGVQMWVEYGDDESGDEADELSMQPSASPKQFDLDV